MYFNTDLCTGCLCTDRKVTHVNDIPNKQLYLEIVNEIESEVDVATTWLCWECCSLLDKYHKFKKKVQDSVRQLQDYTTQTTTQLIPKPFLQTNELFNINYPNQSPDLTLNIKEEPLWTKREESDPVWSNNEPVFNEMPEQNEDDHFDDNGDASPRPVSDDDEILLSEIKKTQPTKSQKTKKKSKRTNTLPLPYTKVSLTQVEIEQERLELASSELYLNSLYKCEKCVMPFPNQDDFTDHNTSSHDLESKYKCDVCQCTFAHEVTYKYHTKRHKIRYECTQCTNRFVTVNRILKHCQMEHSMNVYKCNECDYVFGTEKCLEKHLQKKHSTDLQDSSENEFQCGYCKKVFKWKTSLNKHMERHLIEAGKRRKPACEICNLTFASKTSLRKHATTSSKHQILLKVRKLSETNPQMDSNPKEKAAKIEKISASVNLNLKQYDCPMCDRKFQWKGNMYRHMTSHKAKANGELYCKPCDRSFSSIATYRQHMKLSRKHVTEDDFKYSCDQCNKKFANKYRLQEHINWEHLKNYVHTCDICQKVFKGHTTLYLHKRVVHKVDNTEKLCDLCGKSFATIGKLRSHVTAIHTSKSPYKCDECGATFNWASCLSRHVRVIHKKAKVVEN